MNDSLTEWQSVDGDCNIYTIFPVNAPILRMVYCFLFQILLIQFLAQNILTGSNHHKHLQDNGKIRSQKSKKLKKKQPVRRKLPQGERLSRQQRKRLKGRK